MNQPSTVLVTGASGFLALHCIQQLLEQGYRVRGTLRSLGKESALRQTLSRHVDAGDRLSFVQADLTQDAGWEEAVAGCAHVLHVASPFPSAIPENENDLLIPAREGTLRVLRAARKAGIQRVVLTSSIAAIGDGHAEKQRRFDERDWSNTEGAIQPYPKSKTLAEKAAWAFAKEAGLELVVINPGLILGPSLDGEFSTSGEPIRKLMKREIPGVSRIDFSTIDVRDVAAAHIAAMNTPQAAGQRFICVEGTHRYREIALILQQHFGRYRIPTTEFPDFVVRLVALMDKTVRLTLDSLGKDHSYSSEHIRKVLGWKPRPLEQSVVDMAQSMVDYRVV